MARAFRYYGKKRGHRRTGSPKLGSVGEAAFFAALLLLGCGGLVWLCSAFVLPQWRVNWWVWPLLTVPGSFITIGAGGLIYTLLRWGKSAERRASIARRAQRRKLFHPNADAVRFPFIPEGADMTNSPGTTLKFRLPIAGAAGWALAGVLAFCVLWNGAVAVLAVMAIRAHLAGQPDWRRTLFVVPFLLIGVGAVVYFLRRLLVAAGIGPTRLEISDHPLQPGGEYRLFLSQSGRMRVKALRVSLACEEAATYRQGTNARSETREVYRQELFRSEDFEISGQPFESPIEFACPRGPCTPLRPAITRSTGRWWSRGSRPAGPTSAARFR